MQFENSNFQAWKSLEKVVELNFYKSLYNSYI